MSAVPKPQNNQALEELLLRVNEVAVLPHAVYKILEISGSESAAVSELEKAIVVDPGFSTRLLSHANCAFYGLPKRVTSIKEAVMFLGFKTIRQMAMTVGFFDLFAGKTDKESLRRRAWWRNSIDTAIVSRWIAMETKKVSADEAYTIGLLHMIGKTILDRSQPGAYDEVESLVNSGMSVIGAEDNVYGCNHVEVAMGACSKWGLPDSLVKPLNYVQPVDETHPHAKLIACNALGNAISIAAVEGAGTEHPTWALSLLGIDESEDESWIQRGIEYLAKTGNPSMG